jgi:hypothetical protein
LDPHLSEFILQRPARRLIFIRRETPSSTSRREKMETQALLVEVLISSFFAIACFRARAESPTVHGLAPQRLFVLTDRLERLRRTRWQWFAMVLLLFLVRRQLGAPVVAELTALTQFIVFLSLPSQKAAAVVLRRS